MASVRVIVQVTLMVLSLVIEASADERQIKIGIICDQMEWCFDLEATLQVALRAARQLNYPFQLSGTLEKPSPSDALDAGHMTCQLMKRPVADDTRGWSVIPEHYLCGQDGVTSLSAPLEDGDSLLRVQATCDLLDVPLLLTRPVADDTRGWSAVNLHPHRSVLVIPEHYLCGQDGVTSLSAPLEDGDSLLRVQATCDLLDVPLLLTRPVADDTRGWSAVNLHPHRSVLVIPEHYLCGQDGVTSLSAPLEDGDSLLRVQATCDLLDVPLLLTRPVADDTRGWSAVNLHPHRSVLVIPEHYLCGQDGVTSLSAPLEDGDSLLRVQATCDLLDVPLLLTRPVADDTRGWSAVNLHPHRSVLVIPEHYLCGQDGVTSLSAPLEDGDSLLRVQATCDLLDVPLLLTRPVADDTRGWSAVNLHPHRSVLVIPEHYLCGQDGVTSLSAPLEDGDSLLRVQATCDLLDVPLLLTRPVADDTRGWSAVNLHPHRSVLVIPEHYLCGQDGVTSLSAPLEDGDSLLRVQATCDLLDVPLLLTRPVADDTRGWSAVNLHPHRSVLVIPEHYLCGQDGVTSLSAPLEDGDSLLRVQATCDLLDVPLLLTRPVADDTRGWSAVNLHPHRSVLVIPEHYLCGQDGVTSLSAPLEDGDSLLRVQATCDLLDVPLLLTRPVADDTRGWSAVNLHPHRSVLVIPEHYLCGQDGVTSLSAPLEDGDSLLRVQATCDLLDVPLLLTRPVADDTRGWSAVNLHPHRSVLVIPEHYLCGQDGVTSLSAPLEDGDSLLRVQATCDLLDVPLLLTRPVADDTRGWSAVNLHPHRSVLVIPEHYLCGQDGVTSLSAPLEDGDSLLRVQATCDLLDVPLLLTRPVADDTRGWSAVNLHPHRSVLVIPEHYLCGQDGVTSLSAPLEDGDSLLRVQATCDLLDVPLLLTRPVADDTRGWSAVNLHPHRSVLVIPEHYLCGQDGVTSLSAPLEDGDSLLRVQATCDLLDVPLLLTRPVADDTRGWSAVNLHPHRSVLVIPEHYLCGQDGVTSLSAPLEDGDSLLRVQATCDLLDVPLLLTRPVADDTRGWSAVNLHPHRSVLVIPEHYLCGQDGVTSLSAPLEDGDSLLRVQATCDLLDVPLLLTRPVADDTRGWSAVNLHPHRSVLVIPEHYLCGQDGVKSLSAPLEDGDSLLRVQATCDLLDVPLLLTRPVADDTRGWSAVNLHPHRSVLVIPEHYLCGQDGVTSLSAPLEDGDSLLRVQATCDLLDVPLLLTRPVADDTRGWSAVNLHPHRSVLVIPEHYLCGQDGVTSLSAPLEDGDSLLRVQATCDLLDVPLLLTRPVADDTRGWSAVNLHPHRSVLVIPEHYLCGQDGVTSLSAPLEDGDSLLRVQATCDLLDVPLLLTRPVADDTRGWSAVNLHPHRSVLVIPEHYLCGQDGVTSLSAPLEDGDSLLRVQATCDLLDVPLLLMRPAADDTRGWSAVNLHPHRSVLVIPEHYLCGQDGVTSLSAPLEDGDSLLRVQATCDLLDVPLLLTRPVADDTRGWTAVNLYPHYSAITEALVELIKQKGWTKFTILYEEPEALERLADVLALHSVASPYDVSARQLPQRNNSYRPLLLNLKNWDSENFVVDCQIGSVATLLEQALQVGIASEPYAYIFTNPDLHTLDLNRYSHGGANITGFRMFDVNAPLIINFTEQLNQEYKYYFERVNSTPYHEEFKPESLPSVCLLTYDAIQLLVTALQNITESKEPSEPPDCDFGHGLVIGSTLINNMRMMKMDGLTGTIQFDDHGDRSEILLEVLELVEDGILTKVGNWSKFGISENEGVSTLIIDRPAENVTADDTDSMKNKTFIVLISLTPPYGMRRESTGKLDGNERFEGFCVELIEELSKILGFNYTFEVQEDGKYGNYNHTTRKWEGMLSKVMDGTVDFAITDLTITAEREAVVDFTTPFMNLGISILFRKPAKPGPNPFSFKLPFSNGLWFSLGGAYLGCSVLLYLLGRICPDEWQNPYPCVEEPTALENQFTLANALWFNLGAMLLQGSEIAPVAYGTRAAASMWFFFALIITSSYTANLASLLSVPLKFEPIKGASDLPENQYGITYGAKEGGSTYSFFKDSNNELYQTMYQYMSTHPEQLCNTNDNGTERVLSGNTGTYAFLMESTSIEYLVQRNCDLVQVNGLLDNKGYGLAMQKDSKYRQQLNLALLKLQEQGKLASMKKTWWKEKRGGGVCTETDDNASEKLFLENVGGVFLVLVVGCALGVVMSFVDMTWHVHRRCRALQIPFWSELKAEIKFVFNFNANEKPLRHRSQSSTDSNRALTLHSLQTTPERDSNRSLTPEAAERSPVHSLTPEVAKSPEKRHSGAKVASRRASGRSGRRRSTMHEGSVRLARQRAKE